jgi:hypothetical protein
VTRTKKPTEEASNLIFPIGIVRCPHCSASYTLTCEDLSSLSKCDQCRNEFIYIDGFLNHYRRDPWIFIDSVQAIPIAPGYSVGGEVRVVPDDLQVISYGVLYNRPPELFFIDDQGRPTRDLLLPNLYIATISNNAESFILLSRTFNQASRIPKILIRWMAIGEIGRQEKPIWINILQNAAGLILKSEEQAALVMLQVALDFFIDAILEQMNISVRDVKTASRRWKISDRRTKLKLIEAALGVFPNELTSKLIELAEQRNRLVHGKVNKIDTKIYSDREAFILIVEAITAINDLKYAFWRLSRKSVGK